MEQLKAPKGAHKKKRPVGRGVGSGHGRSSGRGHDGQNSRSGGGVRLGFEGGQMPLFRRIATRGFSNYPFKKEYAVINLKIVDTRFEDGDTVNVESLRAKGLLKKKNAIVKILGDGEITKKLTFAVHKVSASAQKKIEAAGGTIQGIEEGNNG
jgi:large subunit ribosomal protein L15